MIDSIKRIKELNFEIGKDGSVASAEIDVLCISLLKELETPQETRLLNYDERLFRLHNTDVLFLAILEETMNLLNIAIPKNEFDRIIDIHNIIIDFVKKIKLIKSMELEKNENS